MAVWQTALAVAGGLAGLALVAWPALIWWEVARLEKPKYVVIKTIRTQGSRTQEDVELRLYSPYIIAETSPSGGNLREASSEGFRRIAGYIFGKNTAQGSAAEEKIAMTSPVQLELGNENIAMTSPVIATQGSDGQYKLSFVMPAKFTLATLPRPHNPSVVLKEVPSRQAAAVSFSGPFPSEAVVEEKKSLLVAALKEEGLQAEGGAVLCQYYPPFAPGFIRKNEVLVYFQGEVPT